ncbi:SH3 domain-containing protein [Novosphingobium sp. KCTC 2891]|uniref:SH3 domain-containing protein n=1 Tax=Novosphingobium sp. KCTC 2891 TaxID=2989730 RepID=UPI0022222F5F|nr:SH3 domain-containing protein [Novosphingobium sp. KCTC 2891]MCW1381257.1 SH3 domain-containing protein [Novosphingobium sp. KCTC 2891]
MSAEAALTSDTLPTGQLTLSGPSAKVDSERLPVRGDLAHIRLAGKVFVPHYAVPMPRVIAAAGTALRKAGRADADVLAELAAGTVFNVLDLAGAFAWGQVGEDGLVGYVLIEALSGPNDGGAA